MGTTRGDFAQDYEIMQVCFIIKVVPGNFGNYREVIMLPPPPALPKTIAILFGCISLLSLSRCSFLYRGEERRGVGPPMKKEATPSPLPFLGST